MLAETINNKRDNGAQLAQAPAEKTDGKPILSNNNINNNNNDGAGKNAKNANEEQQQSHEARKASAAEMRKARRAARNPRNRLLSDNTHEQPKSILKRPLVGMSCRSISECLDDIARIENEIADISISEHGSDSGHPSSSTSGDSYKDFNDSSGDTKHDCDSTKNGACGIIKKKSVRFDERVYETSFFASYLLERRHFHFSTRHHPPPQSQNNKKSRKNKQPSTDKYSAASNNNNNDENKSEICGGRSKSQRSKQSKRDKKRNRTSSKSSDDATDTSSDDYALY